MSKLKEIAKLLKEKDDFVLGSHVGPDGDSLGGLLALGSFLKQMGKKYCLSSSDAKPVIPPQYNFLPGIKEIKEYKECFEPKVFISLECPSLNRLGVNNKLAKKAEIIINIDHHVDNKSYGHVNWIEGETSSISEMLFDLSKELPVKIDKDIATNLYVGVVTDTGRFQYSNVRPKTFGTVKELAEYGVQICDIFQKIYENRSFFSTVLLGEVMAKAKFLEKSGLIYSTVTNEDFLLNSIEVGETEHFIDFLRAVKGARIAAIFKEVSKKETKISLRGTNSYNVSKIAEIFGGGGHAAASGYTSRKPLTEAIKDLVKAVKSKK